MPETYNPQQDLLDPNAPKKTPAATTPLIPPMTPGPQTAAGPAPSAVDTGIPPPAATPAPPAAPTAAPTAAPAPAPPATTPAPAPTGVTGASGVEQVNAAAMTRLGRQLTPQEIQALSGTVGPPQGPGGTYTDAQLATALDYVGRYSGNLATPFGELAPSAPGSTASIANRRLTELLNLDYGEVDPNSPAMQQQLGAFRSGQSRATDRARMRMAQREQFQGIAPTSGAADASLLGLLEEQGQNEASFGANLYAQELATQRDTLQGAIELATSLGQQDKARLLQEELGKLDIQLRSYLGKGQLALGARQLSQQDQQFLESIGLNYAQLQASMNNDAIRAILGY